jgi:hypothetical protein
MDPEDQSFTVEKLDANFSVSVAPERTQFNRLGIFFFFFVYDEVVPILHAKCSGKNHRQNVLVEGIVVLDQLII